MPIDVIMPQMGESIAEGTLVKWLKKPGDKVQRDENLFNALIASGSGADFIIGDAGDSPFNYGTPRLFRFGAEIRF